MLQLRTLGTLDLRDDAGVAPAQVVAQPKRLGLLLLLALAGRGRFVRRDRLLALFWPELETGRARHALRQALYVLRTALGRDSIVSRGDEEVGIAAGSLWCDVHAFETLLAHNRRVEALDLYAGDLLPSFHVSDVSAEFEHWLEAERIRLRVAAAAAAWSLSDECDAAANIVQAVHWARRAVSVLPEDEVSIRRLLLLLERGGDRLGALQVYAALERRLRDEYDVLPSPETRALRARLHIAEATTARPQSEPIDAPAARRHVVEGASPAPPHASPTLSVRESSPALAATSTLTVRRRRLRLVATSLLLVPLACWAAVLTARSGTPRGEQPPSVSGASAGAGTTSAVALRLYEEGQRAHVRGDARSAYRMFAAALAEDSTFALAAYYAGISRANFLAEETSDAPPARVLLARAVRLAAGAPERDRLIITLEHVRAERARYAAVAESLAARFPAEPVGHLALASVRLGAGDFMSAVAHARRALTIDSLVQAGVACHACDAHELLINAYVYADSLAAAERVARELIRLQPGSGHAWNQLHLVLARQRRRTEAMAAYRRAEALEPASVDVWAPVRVALLADDYEDASQIIALRQRLEGADARSRWWQVISLRNQGRLREALSVASDLARLDPQMGAISHAQVLFELGRYNEAARAFEALAREPPGAAAADAGRRARHVSWMLAHAATAWAALGDTARLLQLTDTVASIAHLSAYGRDWRLPAHMRGLLWQARGDEQRAAEQFRSAVFSPGEGYTRTNFELARMLLALGRPADAIAALQPALRGSVDGANLYVTRTELHHMLARAFEMAGQPDSARAHRVFIDVAAGRPPIAPRRM